MTPAQLKALVEAMRELGVIECGEVKLGPAPAPAVRELTTAEKKDREAAKAERERDVMFAASHVKPLLRGVK